MNKLTLPKISSYGPYSGNYGTNALRVDIGTLTIWFSYETPIAFRVAHGEIVVRQNDWKQTTGKHLNAIDGGRKKSRVPSETFEAEWQKQVAPLLATE